jgi:hypothetical protein
MPLLLSLYALVAFDYARPDSHISTRRRSNSDSSFLFVISGFLDCVSDTQLQHCLLFFRMHTLLIRFFSFIILSVALLGAEV